LLHHLSLNELPKDISCLGPVESHLVTQTKQQAKIVKPNSLTLKSQPSVPETNPPPKRVNDERRIIGQKNRHLNNPPPLPSTFTSKSPSRNIKPPVDNSSIEDRTHFDDDTIISPFPSSLRHSKGTHLPPFSFSGHPHLRSLLDSFFPLQDDPNEPDEIPSMTSSYSDGVLVASSHELTTLEVPEEVLSLIYQQSNSSQRKHSSSRTTSAVGVQSIHTIVFSHNKLSTLHFDKLLPFTSLTHLDLSFNHIQIFPTHLFTTHLVSLKLNRNSLKSLENFILCQSLLELSVAHNEISSTEGLPKNLQKLDLSYNFIDGDLNLRLLSLCSKLISLNLEQNPVISRLKHWRGRLFSLLPKLEEINHELVPKIRKGISSNTSTARGILDMNNTSSYTMRSTTQLRHRSPSPNHLRQRGGGGGSSPKKKFMISPKKMKKSEQEATDLLRHKEYESFRKSREKMEKEKNTLLLSMSKAVHKKPLPEKHLLDLSLRLYHLKPSHVKELEKLEVTFLSSSSFSPFVFVSL
jgi:hypothetical protein